MVKGGFFVIWVGGMLLVPVLLMRNVEGMFCAFLCMVTPAGYWACGCVVRGALDALTGLLIDFLCCLRGLKI